MTEGSDTQRLHVRIRGKVQRVGFRWFVREQARRCDLAGWVRNNPDGSVELCAAGDQECVERLRRALGVGPEGARVDRIEPVGGEGELAELPYPFLVLR